MSTINHNKILKKRDAAQLKCVELRQKIKEMEEQVIALEERVKVYNEFLKGDMGDVDVSSEESSEEVEVKKTRAPRSTKAEMERRKQALIEIFTEHGYLQPKDLHSFMADKMGYVLEQHHLRAVLKRFPDTFVQDPKRHGYWGLGSISTDNS